MSDELKSNELKSIKFDINNVNTRNKVFYTWCAVSVAVCVVLTVFIIVFVYIYFKNNTLKFYHNPVKTEDLFTDISELGFKEMSTKIKYEQLRKASVGINHVRNKSIVFCTILDKKRDGCKSICRMLQLGEFFKEFHIIVSYVEIDEDDMSRGANKDKYKDKYKDRYRDKLKTFQSCLRKITNHPKITLLKFPPICEYSKYSLSNVWRSKYLSIIRNKMLTWSLENYRHMDYNCVFDSGVTGGFNRDGFFECFSYTGWDGISCNGLMKKIANDTDFEYIYWDVENLVTNNEKFSLLGFEEFKKKLVTTRQYIPINKDVKRVKSSFGGCIIYQHRILNNCRYTKDYFDHSSLHKSMRKNGFKNIFINPRWVVFYY